MLSKAQIKFIKSLQVKKYRQQEQCFVVEGAKSVLELLNSDFTTNLVVATPEFLQTHSPVIKKFQGEILSVKSGALSALGEFKSNNTALAIARIRLNEPFLISKNEFVLVLDDIRDPGNLGTIIRLADWYGIDKVIASTETADVYNAKVLHASMGSFTRVRLFYTNISQYLSKQSMPAFGAFLNGENVHRMDWGAGGLIVIGNEAHGISDMVARQITRRVTIPKFGKAESLNAALATAVLCDNLRRGR